ncbi:DUF4129 domain-containing protein [Kineococcus rhizosphaerae]|uniref:Uncharacterized protein DUF4129 n=1 Tax=Kineococcus rhizosphaerae TaxID=559628 RepID=A0A2T0QZZ7_9ACTN|nr:DUF4129 domain-containing protein [Kineococcus rhizosphaerae]PRY12462.1 uncharacterized protein DUF4129 [Kineococcus rhizosphaerae]
MTVPVQPDRPQARQWLAEELSRPEYRQSQGSWLVRAWTWLWDRLERVSVPGIGTGWTSVVVVVVLLVLLVVAVHLVGGPLRRSARQGPAEPVFEAAPEPASAHFARADAAAAAGDHALAVAERFRGLVRSLEERALVETRPGGTATEIASTAALALPDCADALARAARSFDDVRYGGRPASARADEDLRAVVAQVARARPVVPA